jgi:hypothetical protein
MARQMAAKPVWPAYCQLRSETLMANMEGTSNLPSLWMSAKEHELQHYHAAGLIAEDGILAPAIATTPLLQLRETASIEHPLHEIQIPKEILAIAEEINALSDNGGLEQSSLEFLLRMTLFLGRYGNGGRSTPERN